MRKPTPGQYIHIPSHGRGGPSLSVGRRRRRRRMPGRKRLPSIEPKLVAIIVGVVVLAGAGWYFLRPNENSLPTGAVEVVTVDGTTVTISGSAIDLDNASDEPVTLRMTIDGEPTDVEAEISQKRDNVKVYADGERRPNRLDAFTFAPTIDVDGEHLLCVEAVDGEEVVGLGCARAFVRSSIFDDAMLVAHYGAPNAPELGIAGEVDPVSATAAVVAQAEGWSNQNRRVIPAFDLIASVATKEPGASGFYATKIPIADLRPYLDAVRAVDGIIIIDLQTGSEDFLSSAKAYEELLLEPDVHLAVDPEWRVPPGVAPGTQIGSVTAAELNEVSAWLAQLVADNNLPEKIFMIHQFKTGMIKDRELLIDRPELAEVLHIDGFGGTELKVQVYNDLALEEPFVNGLKLFFDEDDVLLTSAEVRNEFFPFPLIITYQ